MPASRAPIRDVLRRWAVPAALALAAAALELGGASWRATLRYERDAVLDGELWRLVSGNLVHLGPRHLVLNLTGLALIAVLDAGVLRGAHGAMLALGAMLGVGLGLLVASPEVGWYVGLSGALHGMLAALALEAALDREARRWGIALLVGLGAKLVWEQSVGPLPYTAAAAGGPVVVDAHLHGALAGVVVGAALAWSVRRSGGGPRV